MQSTAADIPHELCADALDAFRRFEQRQQFPAVCLHRPCIQPQPHIARLSILVVQMIYRALYLLSFVQLGIVRPAIGQCAIYQPPRFQLAVGIGNNAAQQFARCAA